MSARRCNDVANRLERPKLMICPFMERTAAYKFDRSAMTAASANAIGPEPGPVPAMSAVRFCALTTTTTDGLDPTSPASPRTRAINASAKRSGNEGPPWPPATRARSGCAARHDASAICCSRLRNSAPSAGVRTPRIPKQPCSASKYRTDRARAWRSRTPAPSRSNSNCFTASANSSGLVVAATDNKRSAAGSSTTEASARRCSADTAPDSSAAAAPGTFATTSALRRCSRPTRAEQPVARATVAAVSRPLAPNPPIRAADAASTTRRMRSSSCRPSAISLRDQPSGATTLTATCDHTSRPFIDSPDRS